MCQDGENVPMGTLLLFSQVLASMEDDSRELWISAEKYGNRSARNITTDVEIQPDITKGLLDAPVTGDVSHFLKIVWLLEKSVSLNQLRRQKSAQD